MSKSKFTERLLLTTVLAGTVVGTPAVAQESEASNVDTITVTGTLIRDPNIQASSPITSVGEVDLTLSNTVNAEEFLNTLPQVIPGFDATSNNPGIGEATIDLRGLGSVRTLTLVNGRRWITSSQNPGVVDINTIPAALVENVDILTGGASSVYGSDAIAGVVNFQLRDDFEGVQLDGSYEKTEMEDAGIFNTALTMGGNFDGDRGNAVISFGYTNRESLLQGERDEAFFTLTDEGADGGLRNGGSVNIPSTFVLDFSPDYTEALGIDLPCGVEGTAPSGDGDDAFCTTDSFGFIFTPDGPGVDPFINSGDNTNRYNYAPVNYLQIPQERYNIYASATYDVTDTVEAYGRAVFTSAQTEQLLAPTPVFEEITINLDNPFLAGDDEALTLLTALSDGDSDDDGVDDVTVSTGRRFTELGGRLSDIRNDVFQIAGGLRGEFGDDFQWETFASYSQASAAISQTGNVDLTAYRAAVAEGRANIFDAGGLSDEVVDEISVLGTILGDTEQTVLSASIDGPLKALQLPFADVAPNIAVGVEYREDTLFTTGAGLGGNIRGFNQAPTIEGGFDVTDTFVELAVPLVTNTPGFNDLTLQGGFRYSDYSTVGGVESYKVGGSWEPVEDFRVRAVYQRAVRAPNIGELFAPVTNGFPNLADPCSGGANGGFDGSAAVRDNCIADGVPADVVGNPFQVNAQIEGLFGGNEDLDAETADTFTVGIVAQPTFAPGLTVTVDYYSIEVEDVITTIGAQILFDLCYVDGNQDFCDNIDRRGDGTVAIFRANNQNAAVLETSGIDLTVDYSFDLGEYGTLGFFTLANWTEENTFTPLPGADPIDCVGFYGATCNEPTPEFSANTRLDYTYGDFGARLRWRHVDSVRDDQFRNDGEPDLFIEGVDAYNLFELTGFYTLNDNLRLRAGIQNLLDEDYVIIGDSSAEQSNTYPATYDVFGRSYFIGATVNF